MQTITETSRTACFAGPDLCNQLVEAGLVAESPYKWKIYRGIASLFTDVFDIDDFYRDGYKHLDSINPPDLVLPAFSIKDVERVLPGEYLLTFSLGEYEISLDSTYHCESCKADRLPDAFAKLMLLSIRSGFVDMKKVNLILLSK